jgi:hypothetical protein
MVAAMVKAGRMLREIERDPGGPGVGIASPGARQLPTLSDLGFSWSRASRWQLAALLPDEMRLALRSSQKFARTTGPRADHARNCGDKAAIFPRGPASTLALSLQHWRLGKSHRLTGSRSFASVSDQPF